MAATILSNTAVGQFMNIHDMVEPVRWPASTRQSSVRDVNGVNVKCLLFVVICSKQSRFDKMNWLRLQMNRFKKETQENVHRVCIVHVCVCR